MYQTKSSVDRKTIRILRGVSNQDILRGFDRRIPFIQSDLEIILTLVYENKNKLKKRSYQGKTQYDWILKAYGVSETTALECWKINADGMWMGTPKYGLRDKYALFPFHIKIFVWFALVSLLISSFLLLSYWIEEGFRLDLFY